MRGGCTHRKKKSRLDTRDFLQKNGLQSEYLLGSVPGLLEPAGRTQPNRLLPHAAALQPDSTQLFPFRNSRLWDYEGNFRASTAGLYHANVGQF